MILPYEMEFDPVVSFFSVYEATTLTLTNESTFKKKINLINQGTN
jgi:hypothetical protein